MKWLTGVLVSLALVAGALVTFGPEFMLRNPVLILKLRSLVDPIEATRPVVWASGPEASTQSAAPGPPNIVMILVDDLGWNDLTWNGGGVAGGSVPTPNIDSLARDGVQFTMGYAGNATCAPSRAALMTGRYATRFGFESTAVPPALGKIITSMTNEGLPEGAPRAIFHEDRVSEIPPVREQGMPGDEVTIAELLQSQGYRTLMLGKWHLGDDPGQRAIDQGFDEFLGIESGAAMYGARDDPKFIGAIQDFDPIDKMLWEALSFSVRKDRGPRFVPGEYLTDYLSAEAAKAIAANRNRPFFLYLAYTAPHTPLQASKSDYDALAHIESHAERVYAAMIRSLDRGVGEVLDALRANNLEENTLVIFSSDNGAAGYIGVPDLNKPYRGWKMTFFEGGLHSPFFLKWPARIPKGTRSDEPVSHIDLFATAASAAGAPLPSDRSIDGVDLLPYATGDGAGPAHEALFWRSGGLQVVMAKGWKLQVDERQKKRWLFHLDTDPTEETNLIARHPGMAADLAARLAGYNAEVGPRKIPVAFENVTFIDRTLADPRVAGEEFSYWPN